MARRAHIPVGARSTTVYLTDFQRAAISKLQAKRLEESGEQVSLTEALTEGLRLLLEKEGCSHSDLGRIFPKIEPKRAKVRAFPKTRASRSPR